jgi:hypothetical protein
MTAHVLARERFLELFLSSAYAVLAATTCDSGDFIIRLIVV